MEEGGKREEGAGKESVQRGVKKVAGSSGEAHEQNVPNVVLK